MGDTLLVWAWTALQTGLSLALGHVGDCLYRNSDVGLLEKPFDQEREICCPKSGIHNKTDQDGDEIQCCGEKTYKKRKEKCCGDKKYLRTDGSGKYLECCGSTLHKVDTKSRRTDRLRCCGENLMSSRIFGCCNGTQYNESQYRCRNKRIIRAGFDICGEVEFDKNTHSCCERTLYNKPRRSSGQKAVYECCGSSLYDITSEQCCRTSHPRHIQPKQSGCCGKGHYNKSTEICCQGRVHKHSPDISCCGSITHNTSFQGCCGSEVINRSVQNCCGGSVLDVDKQCCGSTQYKSQDHVCCNDKKVIKKKKSQHNSCCTKNASPYSYDNRIEQCKRLPSEQTNCGLMGPFNPKTDLCCNGQKHTYAKVYGKECCYPGHHVYHPKTEICCHSIPTKRTKYGCDPNYKQVTTISSVIKPSKKEVTKPTSFREMETVHGICQICSWKPKLYNKVKMAIREKTFDICRRSAMMVNILSVNNVVQKDDRLKWTILKVKSYKNLYKEDDHLGNQFIYTLIVPCSCKRLQKMRLKKFILITNIDFRKKTLYLGDADTLIPGIKNIPGIIKKRSTSCKF